jgi:hypothetical protein
MLSGGLECFREGWNAFYRVGIHLYRVGIPSYGVGMLFSGLVHILDGWNAF